MTKDYLMRIAEEVRKAQYHSSHGLTDGQLSAIIASVEAPDPVGYVVTTGGYPDDSRREAKWVVPFKELPEGTKLYAEPVAAAPQPPEESAYKQLLVALDKIADLHGAWGPFPENNKSWCALALVTAREAIAAAEAKRGAK